MDTADKRYANFNAFKEDLLQWKNSHQEEYAQFARQMNEGDESQFICIFSAVQQQLPQMLKVWKTCYDDDTLDKFSHMCLYFNEKSMPQHIVESYHKQKENNQTEVLKPERSFFHWLKQLFFKESKERVAISAPLILSWLIFGRSFETMVDMLSSHAYNPKASKIDRLTCSTTIKQIIKASIKSGYRTSETWKEYLLQSDALLHGHITEWALNTICNKDNPQQVQEQAEQPTTLIEDTKPRGRRASQEKSLIEYLNCNNAEGIIDVVRDFVITHNTSYGLALPYYALSELNLFCELINAKEYSIALACEFSDIEGLKSESSCRQAIKWLKDEKHVERDGKKQMLPLIESDEYHRLLQTLKNKISAVINQDINEQ